MLPVPLKTLLDPGLTELGRLPARAPLIPLTGEDLQSRRQSLDGAWRFQLVDSPDAAPAHWQTASDAAWRTIQVPGVWTLQDTGDHPIYSNVLMPFADPHEPGSVPEHNPTGLYRTQFDVNAEWHGDDIVLHVGGFESLALVWCNGVFAGMGKDSRLPSEFDLTPHLAAGTNQLAIMVIKWSDATWIEDQDHWRHGGLHRSVFIEARARTRIDDLTITADFDPATGAGLLRVRAQVQGASAGWQVRARLETASGKTAAMLDAASVEQFPHDAGLMRQLLTSYAYPGHEAALSARLENVAPWSAEQPDRYRLITELINPAGARVETHETWIGFRQVEVSDRRLRINGRPIIIIGVNRHDHHPENGKTPSLEDMRADLILMKRYNINAVRTSHYPNDHRLLDLADELGLYLLDEANVECHARARSVSNDMRYQKAILERVQRMILRDRNHPCVIGWSLGNESGHGPAHDGAAAFARRLDPTRFVHYEGAIMDRFISFWGDPTAKAQNPPSRSERNTTDLVCPMYPPIDFIVAWAQWAEKTKADDRPMILCEFSHAMGNSNGSIADYVDAFYELPALGGGFVWEWRDHGIAKTDEKGRFYWAYGGHFGETRHDGNFCCDGLIGPDGTPHPGLVEYMWAARPVTAQGLGGKRVRLHNRRIFANTSDLDLRWTLLRDGVAIDSGTIDVVLEPGRSRNISIPVQLPKENGAALHLTLDWMLKRDTLWAKAGHRAGWDQIVVQAARLAEPSPEIRHVLSDASLAGRVLQAGPLSIALDDNSMITRVTVNGRTLIDGDITACLWRAPTDNDGVQTLAKSVMPSRWKDWLALGLDRLEMSMPTASLEGDTLTLEREWSTGNGPKAVHRSRWTLTSHGAEIDEQITIPEAWPDIPRAGIRFEVPGGLEALSWYGLGPGESYNDRHRAQTTGRWKSSVDEQYHAFPYPQEHGSHFQTRQFSLTGPDGAGLEIDLPQTASMAARHHHDRDLARAQTLAELERRESIEVHIDAALRGMGTGACGPDTLPAYRVGPGEYRFSWTLKPVLPR